MIYSIGSFFGKIVDGVCGIFSAKKKKDAWKEQASFNAKFDEKHYCTVMHQGPDESVFAHLEYTDYDFEGDEYYTTFMNTNREIPMQDLGTCIGSSAFHCCPWFKSIVISNTVTHINSDAFSYCKNLESIVIPESVTYIGCDAFSCCEKLESIVIPKSVTKIGVGAFSYCESLESITVDIQNPQYQSIDGNLYTKDGKTLVMYATGKKDESFIVPDGVTNIDAGVFYGVKSLKSIVIPESVTYINGSAFYGCENLESITVDTQNQQYQSIDGNLYTKDGQTVLMYLL